MTNAIDRLRRILLKTYLKASTWEKTGEVFGIPGGTAHRIAMTDYEPKRADIRYRLGLPALVPAPVCHRCGQLHVSKRCTARPRKPNPLAGFVILIPRD